MQYRKGNLKNTIVLILILIGCVLYSQEESSITIQKTTSYVPKPSGVYHNSSRIIAFDGDKEGFQILKTYYGWYYDSFYESETYPLEINPLEIEDALYTSYWEKQSVSSNSSAVYWRPCTNTKEITFIEQQKETQLYGYLLYGNELYRIRYWKVSVPYIETSAHLFDTDDQGNALDFEVDKFIQIGSFVYTCVNGLGTRIRNIEKRPIEQALELNFEQVLYSSDGMYLVMGSPTYIRFSSENLDEAVIEQNSKRKPARKPLIEYGNLDFHYDEIERLRK